MFLRVLSRRCIIAARCQSTNANRQIIPGRDGVKKFEEMPGPISLPIVGTHWLYSSPFNKYSFQRLHLTYAKMHEEYGDLVREVMTKDRVIVHVFDVDHMQDVYYYSGKNPYRLSHNALGKYRKDRPHLYDSPGVLPSNGLEWSEFRDKFGHLILSPLSHQRTSSLVEETTNDLLKEINRRMDKNNEVDILPLLKLWGLESIASIVINKRLGCLSEGGNPDAAALIKAAENTHQAVYLTENDWEYKKNYQLLVEAQDVFSGIIKKHFDEALKTIESEENKSCLLYQMLKVPNVSKKDVFTMVVDSFMGGIDTTAITLTFALYHLANWKRVQNKLREHMYEAMPEKNSKAVDGLSENKAARTYVTQIRKETLRLNPTAVGTGRLISKDIVLGGYHIPKHTMCILQHQVASSKNKYFKNASVFEPERWEEKGVHMVSAPFGAAPRHCVGMRIAGKELHMAIAKIVRHYEINYHYHDVGLVTRLMNIPDGPVKLRFTETDDEKWKANKLLKEARSKPKMV